MRQRFWTLDKKQHRNLILEKMKTNEVSPRIGLALCLWVLSSCNAGRRISRENCSLTKLTKQRSEFWYDHFSS